MSSDDPFADLDEEEDDGENTEPNGRFGDLGDDLDAAMEGEPEGSADVENDQDNSDEPDEPDPMATPAFEFSASKQTPIYPREETVDAMRDFIDLDVVAELRRAGVDELEKREVHDAMLSVAMDNERAVRRRVLEERGLETDEVLNEE